MTAASHGERSLTGKSAPLKKNICHITKYITRLERDHKLRAYHKTDTDHGHSILEGASGGTIVSVAPPGILAASWWLEQAPPCQIKSASICVHPRFRKAQTCYFDGHLGAHAIQKPMDFANENPKVSILRANMAVFK